MGLTLGLSNTRFASRSYSSGFLPCDHAGAVQARASDAQQTHRDTLRTLPTFIGDAVCAGLLASPQPALSAYSARPAARRAVEPMVRFMFIPVFLLRLVK